MSTKNAVYAACAIVLPLTWLWNRTLASPNLFLTAILFIPLFPGIAVQTAIGHGGTWEMNAIGMSFGVICNVCVYAGLIIGGGKLWKRVRRAS